MNPIFVSTSRTLDITDFSTLKTIGNINGIELERFTVGGYDWAIEFYPQGINVSVSDYISIYVKLLNATKLPEQAKYSIRLWDWITSEWFSWGTSDLVTIIPTNGNDRWGYDRTISNSITDDGTGFLKNDTMRIRYTFMVTPQLQAPAPALIPDVAQPPGNTNQGNPTGGNNPSGGNNSYDNGFHTARYAPPNAPSNQYTKLPRQPTVRIYCEAAMDFSLTARNGHVVLAPADSNDHYQHWIKDMNSYNEARAPGGNPIFALVNRVTGQVLKNPDNENEEVKLFPYNQNGLGNTEIWTELTSIGFRAITTASTPNLTAVPNDAGIFNDGAKIVVQRPANTPNQLWNIVPYNSNVPQ